MKVEFASAEMRISDKRGVVVKFRLGAIPSESGKLILASSDSSLTPEKLKQLAKEFICAAINEAVLD